MSGQSWTQALIGIGVVFLLIWDGLQTRQMPWSLKLVLVVAFAGWALLTLWECYRD